MTHEPDGKTLQDHYERVKAEKESMIESMRFKYSFASVPHTICNRKGFCKTECPFYKRTCYGCTHVRCMGKVCGMWCEMVAHEGKNLCYHQYERCGRMPLELFSQEIQDIGTLNIQDIIDQVKPTKPLDLDTIYIPTIQPYGQHAPGEIVKYKEAFVDCGDTSNLCMIPSNQLPLNYPPREDELTRPDPEKIFLKNVDLKKYLGVIPKTDIFLNFRMKDFLLDYWWSRIVYDQKNSPLQTLFKGLKDLGIKYTVSINFSLWDSYPLYQNYFNIMRSWITYIHLQKYFDKVVLEFDNSSLSPQIGDWYVKMVNEGGIATIHQNFQIRTRENEMEHGILRQKMPWRLECEEIILGGAAGKKEILKYQRMMGKKRLYITHTRAYLPVVFQQHISGKRWKEKIPPSTDEIGRAMYYKNLFEANVRWYVKELNTLNLWGH